MKRGLRRASLWCALLLLLLAQWGFPPSARAQDRWLGPDKPLHFAVSGVLAGGSYAVSSLLFESRLQRTAVSASVALSAGVAKEVYDELDYGGASYKDFVFDVAGTAVGVVAAWLIDIALDDEKSKTIAPSGGALTLRF